MATATPEPSCWSKSLKNLPELSLRFVDEWAKEEAGAIVSFAKDIYSTWYVCMDKMWPCLNSLQVFVCNVCQ